MEIKMYLILFTGAPASGKSSIASVLSEELGIDMVSKDALKIELFEKYGFNSHEEKKKLSMRSEDRMYEVISAHIKDDKSLIVDNNFKNFDRIRLVWEEKKKNYIICINLVADSQHLAERYNMRIEQGNRHEALYTLDIYPIIHGKSHFHQKLTKEDVIRIQKNVTEETYGDFIETIDSNNLEQDFDAVLDKIRLFVKNIMGD